VVVGVEGPSGGIGSRLATEPVPAALRAAIQSWTSDFTNRPIGPYRAANVPAS
jgi:hypothetical protein